MKSLITAISVLLLHAAPSQAAELACWNLYSPYGDRPSFTASIRGDGLTNIRMLTNRGPFGDFVISDVTTESKGFPITSSRSPYKGGQSYQLTADGDIRIILPPRLDSDFLKNAFFRAGNLPEDLMRRQNGVIEVAGRRHQSGGSIFIRMHCLSKN